VLAYIVIFGSGFILLRRLVRIGPADEHVDTDNDLLQPETRAARPLSAASANASGGSSSAASAVKPVGPDDVVPPSRRS
ncbi:MAG: cytochrome bd ubiquinol oxidase subunit, partial [Caballeronia sp.]|nr:cytochrome bd ubiquinol oxidase subunit [Caballeronia sp.]